MLVLKKEFKKAMKLNAGLTDKLNYKAEMVSSLSDQLVGLKTYSPESVEAIKKVKSLKKAVELEMLDVVGAMASEYKKAYGENLFSEFVNYKHYTELTGEARVKTVGQMVEILRMADECCREIWGDYLMENGDSYMVN